MTTPSLPISQIKSIIRKFIVPQINISPCFYNQLKDYGKIFVEALTIQLNQVCQKNNNTYITTKILYQTLIKLGLEDLIEILKVTENNIKQQSIIKKQKKKIIRQNIQKIMEQTHNKKSQNKTILENFGDLKQIVYEEEDQFNDIEEIENL